MAKPPETGRDERPTAARAGPSTARSAPAAPALLLVLAGVLVGAAIALSLLASEKAQPLIIGLLALLAVVGVFALFAGAVGIIEFAGRDARNDLTKVDGRHRRRRHAGRRGRRARRLRQRGLSAARRRARRRTTCVAVERLFTGSPDVSEAIYRLAQASRDGQAALRGDPPVARRSARFDGAAWYRVKVRPVDRPGRRGAPACGPSPT